MILETDPVKGYGKLFLGGFKAIINKEFQAKEDIKGCVNTVGKGLFGLFGQKFEVILMVSYGFFLFDWKNLHQKLYKRVFQKNFC